MDKKTKVLSQVVIGVITVILLLAFVRGCQKQERAKEAVVDPGVVTTKFIAMPATWTQPVVIPDRTPWVQIFPQDGVVHYYVKAHHRFSGDWKVLGPFTRADNNSLGDNIDMVEFMSGETVPITMTFIRQKP